MQVLGRWIRPLRRRARWCLAVVFVVLLGGSSPSWAQQGPRITGFVTAAETGRPLVGAHVRIAGTRRGTVTNDEGRYALRLDSLPVTLVVRYVGYETKRRAVRSEANVQQDVQLQTLTYRMADVTDRGDFAEQLMRRVIRHKKQWRSALNTYQARAYSRFVLANDTSIAFIEEATSRVFWRREHGNREVVTSRRRTAHAEGGFSAADATHLPNFYDDDIRLAGFRVAGPTHPEALAYYRFSLLGRASVGADTVYKVAMTPRKQLQPAFSGTLYVQEEPPVLRAVRLRPTESILFPPPVQAFGATYQQQFDAFGEQFWLPLDMRLEGRMDVGVPGIQFPTFHFRQLAHLGDYRINVPVPDSLFRDETALRVEPAAAETDSLHLYEEPVPLSEEEKQAFAALDSTDRLAKSFRPRGLLTRLGPLSDLLFDLDVEVGRQEEPPAPRNRIQRQIRPQLWYNRVDGFHLALAPRLTLDRRLRFTARGGYKTNLARWTYGGEAALLFGPARQGEVALSYNDGTDRRYGRGLPGARFANGLDMLLGDADYFDYFDNERWRLRASYLIRPIDLRVGVRLADEQHASVATDSSDITRFDLRAGVTNNILTKILFGGDDPQRLNPPIKEGRLRSVKLELEWRDGSRPLGVAGKRGVRLSVEHSDPAWGSDYDFTKFAAGINWRFETFLQRRLLPMTLDVYATGGTHLGDLPLQRFGTVAGGLSPYPSFGILRTLDRRPYEGPRYLAFFWEHNFRTVPFELLGWDWLVDRGLTIVLHGGHGRTWITDDVGYDPNYIDHFHHEVGLSLNGILGLARLDLTVRLDRFELDPGVGLARVF